jgi:hypothetical protein
MINYFLGLMGNRQNNTIKLDPSLKTKVSKTIGTSKGTPFDDYDYVCYRPKFHICEVKVFLSQKYVIGILIVYDINGVKKTVGNHSGTEESIYDNSLKLSAGEYINKVGINAGDWIDGIGLFTNKGKDIQVGGDGGSTTVFELPEGCCVTAFAGTNEKYLNSIKFYYDKIN